MKLILEMRSKLGLAADGRDPNRQSIADGSTDDAMVELAAETHGSGDRQHTSEAIRGIRGQGHDRTRYYDNPARDTVVTLSMPAHCPEAKPDATETTQVQFLMVDRKSIYIHVKHIPWLIYYLPTGRRRRPRTAPRWGLCTSRGRRV